MFPNQDHGHLSVLEDGTLLITSVRAEDSGEYLCKGLSIAGTAVAKVRLNVIGKHLSRRRDRTELIRNVKMTLVFTVRVGHQRYTGDQHDP